MILFENVVKKHRGSKKPALDGVSVNINRGEFVFLVGASGSGKSSCLRMILREDKPSSGMVHVLGQNLSKISARKVPFFRRNLGVVFQDFRLLTNKTVFDNVAFSLQVIGKSRGFIQEAVPDVLELVGLKEKAKRFPHELSGGEQQRVAIARAIVNKPAILLADEPTGNLDPATSLGIMQLLRAINAAGTTIVMATHEAVFVDVMQQRVIELQNGKVVRDEIGGGYGHTAALPTQTSVSSSDPGDGREQVLRASEEAVRRALSPMAPVEPVAAAKAEEHFDDSYDPPTEETIFVAKQEMHLPENFDHTEIAEINEEKPEEPEPLENRIPFFLREEPGTDPVEMDPVEIVESGGFAKHLGLEDTEDPERGER